MVEIKIEGSISALQLMHQLSEITVGDKIVLRAETVMSEDLKKGILEGLGLDRKIRRDEESIKNTCKRLIRVVEIQRDVENYIIDRMDNLFEITERTFVQIAEIRRSHPNNWRTLADASILVEGLRGGVS